MTTPLWAVASERRTVVEPASLGDVVAHYSIPNVDALGGAALEASGGIRSAKLHVQAGDILISRLNPRKPRVVTVQRHAEPAVASTEFIPLVPRRVDPRFLHYFLSSEATAACLDARVQSVTRSHQRVEAEVVLRLLLPGLDSHHQRHVADFLDEQVARLAAAIDAARQTQALLEQRALTGLHDAVTGRGHRDCTPSPMPWARELPAHWQVAKLSLVARMGTGHTPSRSNPELWVDTSIPWLTTNDVHRFRRDEIDVLSDPALNISRAGLANSAAVLHPAGTVALSRTASAGFSVIMGRDMATSQDFVTWTCGPLLQPHYLLAVLRASRQDVLGRLAMGSTHKTIYFPDLEALRVPLPPLQEQERAVGAVQRVQREARESRAEVGKLIDLLQERKRALITACVTGEFDVSAASGPGRRRRSRPPAANEPRVGRIGRPPLLFLPIGPEGSC
jgi:type I restriction enzyme S subunit